MPLPIYSKGDKPSASRRRTTSLNQVKQIVGIAAGKGGVGKSTLTVNLGEALRALGYAVGILDSDVYGPSLRMMLPEDLLPSQEGERIQPAMARGIKTLSIAHFRKKGEAAAIRSPLVNRLIAHFIHDVDWGALDYLLVDFPPGTGDVHLTLAQQAPLSGVLIVTTPQEVALLDVRKAAVLFKKMGVPVLGVVENMSYYQADPQAPLIYPFGKGGGEKLAAEFDAPLLGAIPLDPLISACADQGRSLFSPGDSLEKGLAAPFVSTAKQLVNCLSAMNYKKNARDSHQLEENSSINAIAQIKEIKQTSNNAFSIEWTDGLLREFRLCDLQRHCPCAQCCNQQRESDYQPLEQLRALSIQNVGNYGLRIQFNLGCSFGIYTFDFLRTWNR